MRINGFKLKSFQENIYPCAVNISSFFNPYIFVDQYKKLYYVTFNE